MKLGAVLRVFALGFLFSTMASAATETYYYYVYANPVAEHEAEFNQWYDQQHAFDVVAVPGFMTAQRYVKNDLPLYREADVRLPKYLIVYKIVTDNLESVFAEVERRLRDQETLISPTFDRANSVQYVYRVFRSQVAGVGGEPPNATPGVKRSYLHVVFTPFVEGKEEEFNTIYDRYHAIELASIPGFTSAQRMILARPRSTRVPATKYLAVFQVETSDLAAVKELTSKPVTPNPGQDVPATRGYTFRAIGPLLQGDQVRADRAAAQKARGTKLNQGR